MVLHGDGKPHHEMEELLSQLATKPKSHDARGIKEVHQKIIPEYVPDLEAKSIVGSRFIDARELPKLDEAPQG